jgi:hypothetical protein
MDHHNLGIGAYLVCPFTAIYLLIHRLR